MRRNSRILLIMVVLICILPACQPTPEEQVITQKDDLEELIQKTASPEGSGGETLSLEAEKPVDTDEPQPTEEPKETYKETLEFEDEVFKVIIDAVIDKPDGSIPVAKVEPYVLTQEEVDRVLELLMPNQQLYQHDPIQDYMARETTQKQIFKLESLIAEIKGDETLDEQIRRSLIAIHSTRSGMLESRLDQCTTDSLTWIETTSEIQEADINGVIVSVKADMGKSLFAIFVATNNTVNFVNRDFDSGPTGIKRINGDIPGMETTFNEAKELAENAIKQVSLLDDISLDYAELGVYRTVPDEDWIATKYIPKKYMFYFTRVINGIQAPNIQVCKGFEQEGVDYDYHWLDEYIYVTVDDTGIVGFMNAYIGKITEIINDNVEVIDFDEAMEIFRKQIFYKGVWTGQGVTFSELNITKIQLNMYRLRLKDTNEYMYVPVWDFIGTWKTNNYGTEAGKEFCFLTINAIDGSVIDRDLGY